MPNVLARLKHVPLETIHKLLLEHAPIHAKEGMYFERIWKNVDADEVLFLFRTDNLAHAKEYIAKTHAEALKQDPKVNLPMMTFLE